MTKTPALLSDRKVATEHDPVHSVIVAFQQLIVVFGEIVLDDHHAPPGKRFRSNYAEECEEGQLCPLKMEVRSETWTLLKIDYQRTLRQLFNAAVSTWYLFYRKEI